MKNLTYLIALLSVVFMSASCEKVEEGDFTYTEYPHYFVSYQDDISDQGEFFVLTNETEFLSVFHPAATMDNQVWIDTNDFKNKVAIGIIKEFNNVCQCPELSIQSIELLNKKIVYKYSLTGVDNTGNISCDMMCRPNLLVMVDSDSFTSIEFYENDVLIKTIDR